MEFKQTVDNFAGMSTNELLQEQIKITKDHNELQLKAIEFQIKAIRNIRNNIIFFFWITMIAITLGVLASIISIVGLS